MMIRKYQLDSMDNKRKAVFTGHVLNKLFPPIERTVSEDIDKDVTAPRKSRSTDVKEVATDKVYGAHLPQEVRQQLQDTNNTVTTSGEDSCTDDDEPLPKRKRKKRRGKRRRVGLHPAQHNTSVQGGPLELNESSKADAGSGDHSCTQATSTVENTASLTVENTASLTKNQKRKLRKKRRRGNATEVMSEFTFEPTEKDTRQDEHDEEQGRIDREIILIMDKM